jgi:hypothetical protein
VTVTELIQELKGMPGDLDVIYVDDLTGPDVIETAWLRTNPGPRCVVLE